MTTGTSRPEGTITSLPTRNGKGAPDIFKGDYRDVEQFLDHFEALCDEKNVVKGEHKCKGLVRYCSREVRETLEGLQAFTDKHYDDFKKEFIYHYDKDREKQRYKLKDLYSLARKWRERKIENLETFKRYHLKYLRIGGWLLKHKKLVESEHRRWFWAGLHKKFRKRVETHMRMLDSKLDDSVPFTIEKVVAAAKKLYNRERFDEDELMMYPDAKGTRNDSPPDSEIESDEDSSDSDSSSDDSDDESEDEKRNRRRKKKRLRKEKGGGKSSKARKDEKSRNSPREDRERDIEDEIGELVTKMSKLDVSDTSYLAMWVRLIRKAPELQDCGLVRKPALPVINDRAPFNPNSRVRQPPPHPVVLTPILRDL